MAGAIAKANVLVTTNADPMNKGLAAAGKDAEKWGKSMGGKMKSGMDTKGSAGGLSGMLGKGGAFALGAIAVTGLVQGLESLVNKFGELSEQIDQSSKRAVAFGVSTEFLTGLQHAADLSGIGIEELDAGLMRFRRTVSGPMDEALLGMADRLSGISDAGERAKILSEAFGKSGLKFAAVFAEGREGIQKMIEENKALGNSFTEEQGRQVEAANDAVTRVKKSVGGLFKQFLIGAAPALEFFATGLQKGIAFVKPVFDMVHGGIQRVWRVGKAFFDGITEFAGRIWGRIQPRIQPIFDYIEEGWNTVKEVGEIAWSGIMDVAVPVAEEIIYWVGEGIDLVSEWAGEIFGFANTWPSARIMVVEAFRMMAHGGAFFWDSLKYGAGLGAKYLGQLIEWVGKLATSFKSELKDLATMGGDAARALGLDDTAKDFDAVGAAADKIGDRIQGAGKDMQNWGQNAMDGFGDSAKKFDKWFDNALKKKRYAEKTALADSIADLNMTGPAKFSGTILAKSTEAYSMVLKNQFRDLMDKDDTGEKSLKEHKKANNKLDKTNKLLDDVNENLDGIKTF